MLFQIQKLVWMQEINKVKDMGIQVIVLVVILFVALFIGTPVSYALGLTASVVMVLFMGPSHFIQLSNTLYNYTSSSNLLVIPMFVLMAELLAQGNIAADIFNVLNRWTRKIRGGLAISATLASTVFAALCGSSPATAAVIGRISISEMQKNGYDESLATGSVAAGGTLGIMIPPSIAFVTYGILTETSISKLLMAGLLPGLMIALILCLFIFIRGLIKPSAVGYSKEKIKQLDKAGTSNVKEALQVLPALILIILVLCIIYFGIGTPNEAAGIGCIGAFIILLIQKRMNKKVLKATITNAVKTTVMIVMLTACGMCLSYVVSFLGIPQMLAQTIGSSGLNKWIVFILLVIMWLILGCLMDPSSMIVLTIPFIFPTLMALGFDPIWVGVVATLAIEIGMITPPVGMNLFVIKSVSTVPMIKIIKGSLPFIVVLIICLIILCFIPQIALIIPSGM